MPAAQLFLRQLRYSQSTMFKGKNGHIAIRTNSVELAVAGLAKKGFAYDESSAKYKNGRMTAAYLKDEFGGFAVHLLQK